MIGGNAKKSFSGGYPTRAEFSRLLKTGVLLTAAGTLDVLPAPGGSSR